MGQTVNLLSYDFGGSNPSLPTIKRGKPYIGLPLFWLTSSLEKGSVEIDWGLYWMTLSIHCGNWGIWQALPIPLLWMTQRLAEVLIRVLNHIGKTSVFSETSYFYGVAPDESTETGRQQRENFTKAQWKNYDFTMFLSRIIPSRYIAVKWLRRVYWLLPLSIVASFKKNRRFPAISCFLIAQNSVMKSGRGGKFF